MAENIFAGIEIFRESELIEDETLTSVAEELESERTLAEAENEEPPICFGAPDDTAEPIPSEEAPNSTIPLPVETTIPDPNEDSGHLTELVCEVCLELNITQKSAIECARCGKAFCFHYASTVDAQYCVNCMSEISVTKQVITKSYEHKNPETGEKSFYRRRAREIKIDGLDWLFAQRKIVDMTDVELDLGIEYHRNICSLMLAEQERKRIEYMHRNAGRVVVPGVVSAKVTDTTTTTVKKVRVVSKDKKQEQLKALLSTMAAKGVDLNSLAAMLAGKK